MNRSKLIQLIQTFDKKEKVAFRKFLLSPYFNNREDVVRLWDYLLHQLPRGQPALEKASVFAHVYPGKPYHDRNFHLLKTYLFRLLEDFLIVEEQQADKTKREFYLLRSYQQKNLDANFQSTAQKLEKRIASSTRRDTQFFEQKRDLLWETYQLQVAKQPSGHLFLSELMEQTDITYYSRKLHQICLLSSQQSVYAVQYSSEIEKELEFLPRLEKEGLIDIPAIGIYFYGYKLTTEPDNTDAFFKYRDLLFENHHLFTKRETRELFLIGINFGIRQVNSGDRDFFSIILDLYQRGLESEALLENGKLSRFTYHNVVATGLQATEYEWVRNFIVEYQPLLEVQYRESSFQYNMARWEFEQQQYDSALERLTKANFSDVLLNLAAKTISLKIYYHLGNLDLLQAHISAMNNYIRRKRVLGYHHENYLNITRYAQKLINLNKYDKEASEKLKELVKGEKVLTEKSWFLEQLL